MKGEDGFTLIELLFALVAGSLLLIALGWSIKGLQTQFERYRMPTAAEQIEAIAPFLTSEVSRARPPATGAAFIGSADHLLLTVPPPQTLGPVGLLRLNLWVAASRHGKALMAQILPLVGTAAHNSKITLPVTLADGFSDIRFVYTRRASDAANALPRLITFQFQKADGTIIPLGVEPRLTMAADCQFDPISLTCRR